MSIRAKLLIPLAALPAVVLGVVHFGAVPALKEDLTRERLTVEGRTLELMGLALTPDVLAGDLSKIHNSLDEAVRLHPRWHALTLISASGNRLYPLKAQAVPGNGNKIEVPIGSVGHLSASVDVEALVAPVIDVLLRLEAILGALLLAGGAAVLWLQENRLAVPLSRLAEAAHSLSEGKYDTALPVAQGSEVNTLIRAFGDMRDAVALREAALLAGERRLQAVIDNSAEAVLSLDAHGLIQSVNRTAETMFAASAQTLCGMPLRRVLEEEAFTGIPEGAECVGIGLDGREFPAWVTARDVRLSEAETILVVTIIDLSERKRAEQQLKDSEGRFRDLAVSASDWFWETDSENRLTFVSDRIGEILGGKPSAVLGFTYFDFGLADYDAGLAQAHAEDLEAHRPFRDLVFAVGPEGAKDGKIIRISGMPFFDEDGTFIGYRGVGADITELRRREQAIELLTHRYQLILDSAGDGIVELNALGVVGFANRGAAEMLHLSPEQMLGRNFAQLVRASEADGAVIVGACTDGVAERVNDAIFNRDVDGSAIPVEFLAAPIIENDVADGAVLVFRDISMRKRYEKAIADQNADLERLVEARTAALSQEIKNRSRTEAALRASRKHLKGITDSLFEGVIVVNSECRISFANPSARRLLRLDDHAEELEGHRLDDLISVMGGSGTPAPWQISSSAGEIVRDDDAAFRLDGRILAVAYACSPVVDEDGRRGAVLSFRDIEALKQAQNEAFQSSRLAGIGQLAAGIAHEINTPIQYVGDNLGFIRNALGEISPLLDEVREVDGMAARFEAVGLDFLLEELPAAVDQSLDGVAQVARIVRSMKEFSHPGTTQKSAVDVNRALESTLTVSRSTWKHVASVETDFDGALPLVHCHPGEMNQVFLNLVVNAAHAIEGAGKPLPGSIRITTRKVGEWAEIEVADSGTGIPEDIRRRIFDPFFTTKAVGKGTGQGLSICYDVVVVKHHGQITVGGEPGQGAIFTVRLPLNAVGADFEA